jgi:transposase
MAYSLDFRQRALDYTAETSRAQAARVFHLSPTTIRNWQERQRAGNLAATVVTEHQKRKFSVEELKAYVAAHPDLYLHEYAAHFGVVKSNICYTFKKLGITHKKKRNTTGKAIP